jgi:hypothetical protein
VHRDWQLDTASAVFAGLMAHPSGSPQTESKCRVSSLRARHKRGPPIQLRALELEDAEGVW